MIYDNRIFVQLVCTKVLGKTVVVNNDLFGGITYLVMNEIDPTKAEIKETLCEAGTVLGSLIIFVLYQCFTGYQVYLIRIYRQDMLEKERL